MEALKKVTLICTAILSTLGAANSFAVVPYNNVKILDFAVGGPYGDDAVLRLSTHDNEEKPACAHSSTWTLRIDGSTEGGKLAIGAAMLAQATGANVDFYGEDECIGSINKLRWIMLDN